MFKVRQADLVTFLLPCCSTEQDYHASYVEPWTPKKWSLSHFEVERIRFFQEWWIKYYDYGVKTQMTIKAGSILVKMRQDEEAVLQAELEIEKRAKLSARANAAKAKTAKKIEDAVKKETKRLAEENFRIHLEKDQLVKRLRGGDVGDADDDCGDITTNTPKRVSSSRAPSNQTSNMKANSPTKPTVVEDQRVDALATEISNLKDIVVSILNATTASVQVYILCSLSLSALTISLSFTGDYPLFHSCHWPNQEGQR